MAHTLTFSANASVTVDGVNISSPYPLTQNCTIILNQSTKYDKIILKVNGVEQPITSYTISLSNVDIDLEIVRDDASIWDTFTINYTESGGGVMKFKHFYDAGTIGSGTVKFRHYSQTEPIPQLATPQNVSASGTIVSWDAVENATSYEILVGGSSFGTISITSVDLSTLSGWASLTDGDYSVTVIAKADGYANSEPSAAVSVTKTSGFTLQLNVYHLGRQAFVKKDGTATPTDYDYYYRYGDEGIKIISGINAYITVLNERGDAVYFYDKVNCSSSGDGSSLATLTLNSDASARLELSD